MKHLFGGHKGEDILIFGVIAFVGFQIMKFVGKQNTASQNGMHTIL